MIAADTSTWVAFLEGAGGEDAKLLDGALEDRQVLMVPVVLTELLSDPKLPSAVAETLAEVPLVEIEPGYWQRAGALRARVLARSRRARLGDALIARAVSTEAFLSLRETETSGRSPKLRVLIWYLGRERTEPTSPGATALLTSANAPCGYSTRLALIHHGQDSRCGTKRGGISRQRR